VEPVVILQQLILAQEWQRVRSHRSLSARIAGSHRCEYTICIYQIALAFGVCIGSTEQVVQRMLELNVDAAAFPVQSVRNTRTRANLVPGRRFRRGRKMAQTQQGFHHAKIVLDLVARLRIKQVSRRWRIALQRRGVLTLPERMKRCCYPRHQCTSIKDPRWTSRGGKELEPDINIGILLGP
jgi:hypothetical protein